MKKKLQEHGIYLLGILLIAIFSLSYVYKDVMQAHDISFHLANIGNLINHHLKVEFIMPGLAHNLGYGLYLFYPFLPHLIYGAISSFLSVFSVSLYSSVLFSNIVISFLSSFFMYLLSYRIFKKKKPAFLSALIYLLFPYRLGTITVRMALNENLCGLFIPIILLSLTYLFGENFSKKKFLLLFVTGYVGLIFSHLVLSLFFSIFFFLILLFFVEHFFDKRILLTFLQGVFLVSILVLPNLILLLEHSQLPYLVYHENYMTSFGLIQENLLSFQDLLIPTRSYDWTIPFYISLPVICMGIYSGYLAFSKKKMFFMLLSVLCCLVLFLVTFEPIWKILPSMFYMIQFPWRLLLLLSVFLSLLAPLFLEYSKKYFWTCSIVFLLLFSSILCYKLSTRIYLGDYSHVDIDSGLGNLKEYYPDEYLENSLYYDSKNSIDILSGTGNVQILSNARSFAFSVDHSSSVTVELPKIYYKGYVLKNQDGKVIPLSRSSMGFLLTTVEDGSYTLTYRGTILYVIFRIFRFVVFLFLLFFSFFKKIWRAHFQ